MPPPREVGLIAEVIGQMLYLMVCIVLHPYVKNTIQIILALSLSLIVLGLFSIVVLEFLNVVVP